MDSDEILCDDQLYPGAQHNLSLNFPEGVLGRRTPHPPKLYFSQNTLSIRYFHIKNLNGSKEDTLLSVIGVVSKVSAGKQGQGSRNKQGRNLPILDFGSELLDYLTYLHKILCKDALEQYGPRRTKTDRNGPKLTKTDQNGPERTEIN